MTEERPPAFAGEHSAAGPRRRRGARVIVRDSRGRLLLFEGADPAVPEVRFWITPGGGLDPGETFEEAAARELFEETGFEVTRLGESLLEEQVEFAFEGVRYLQSQRFYAVEVAVEMGPGPAVEALEAPGGGGRDEAVPIELGGWTEYERRWMAQHRWWTLDEIEATTEMVYPPGLADLARSITEWGSARRLRNPL